MKCLYTQIRGVITELKITEMFGRELHVIATIFTRNGKIAWKHGPS